MKWPSAACTLILLLALAMPSFASAGQGHFTITYITNSASGSDDPCFLDALEKAYDCANGCFGTCPARVEVIVVDDEAMDKEAGEQVDSFSAWNMVMSAVVLRQTTLNNSTLLPIILKHEIAHLAINDILYKKDPREFQWMEEGVCTLFSKEPLSDKDVSAYIVGHGFLGVGDIYGAIKSENCTVSKNGYMQSYSLVRRMAQRYGKGAVLGMLESPEASLEEAFKKNTGEDFRAFYDEWKKEVTKRASQ